MNWLEKLTQIKKASGKTHGELSVLSGVPKSTIDKLFANITKNPPYITVEKIVHALGYSMDALSDPNHDHAQKQTKTAYHNKGFGVIGEERDPEYTNKYNSLDKEARARIKNVLDFEYEKLLEKRTHERVRLIAPSTPVCAGYGNYLDDNIDYEEIDVVKNKYTFGATHIIKLQGDSMEPEFHDGDKLIVTETKGENPINGRVGIFIVNGSAYLRQLLDGVLRPYNPAYPEMTPNEYDRIDYVGYVVGIIDDSWIIE